MLYKQSKQLYNLNLSTTDPHNGVILALTQLNVHEREGHARFSKQVSFSTKLRYVTWDHAEYAEHYYKFSDGFH